MKAGPWARRLTALLALFLCLSPTYVSAQAGLAGAPRPPVPILLRADQVALLLRTLSASPSHGLPDYGFLAGDIESRLSAPDAATRSAAIDLLIQRALAYARDVHAGRLPPVKYRYEWGMRPPLYDPLPEFAAAVADNRLGPWLDSLPPPYPGYQALRRGLVTYQTIQQGGGWKPLSPGPSLKLGMTDPRVVELRARLSAEDPNVDLVPGPVFDDALSQALARAQKRFGLEPDGALGPGTLAALNLPVEVRLDQIVANMERWRWTPSNLPAHRIQVNIAAAVLTLFKNDVPVLSMRAVTGRPRDETPMLTSQVHSIVFNPPWNVPAGIAAKELLPKEAAQPGYLAANDFIVVPTADGGTRLVQKAGDKAALGLVKFDFANPYGVYLHDTPSRQAFSRYGRLASHGCVRLEKPQVLAKALLDGDPQWTPEAIDAVIASGKTVRAQIIQPVAVYLFYWTAYVAPDGQVNFRQDPYGWDRDLVRRLPVGPN